jgi:RHS repeat-associated protein
VEEYLNASGTPHNRHLWGLRSRWNLVKRLSDASGSLDEKRYALYDAMDPVAICDESAAIKQRYEYSPFGQTTFMDASFVVDATPESWNFLFHGEFKDAGTGYYNYGCRYYNDTTGRWVSRDPIEESGGFNLYSFVINTPLRMTDILGAVPVRFEYPQDPRDVPVIDIKSQRQDGTQALCDPDGFVRCMRDEDCDVSCEVWVNFTIILSLKNVTDYAGMLSHEQRHA